MMSCKVERFYAMQEGAGLQATVPVSPGEELYVAEPFAYTVKETARGLVCEFCLLDKNRLLRCSQCKYAKYCSKPCQAKAWPEHKRECKCLDNVFTSDHVDTFRLAIRVVFKMIRNAPCPSESLCSMSELCESVITVGEIQSFDQMLLAYMKEEIAHPAELPDNVDLSNILHIVDRYRHPIVNDELTKAGVGMYPIMCLLKHSCEPNCCIAFMGSAAHLRAIRQIQAGEQLTVAWFSPMMPTEQRQSLHRKLFCFECHCHRCETRYLDKDMLAGDKQASDQTRDMLKVLTDLRLKKQWLELLLVCETQLARNRGRVPDKNIYQLEVLHSAMEACLALCRPKEGLPYAYRALKTSRRYSLGINYDSATLQIEIAALECLVDESKASKTISEAAEIIELFFGRSHPYVKRIKGEIGASVLAAKQMFASMP